MKVVIENKIPYISGVLDGVAQVVYLSPEAITRDSVRDADALIVRTRTRCDAALLDGSSVKWIATATIGTDHIDLGYCRARGIKVVNAPGCNAPAVAQYVFAALNALDIDPVGKTMGIVGVGNVGRIVEHWATLAGMNVLRCDPPRARREGEGGFVSIDTVATQSDIVTFHVPLTRNGDDATYHLAGRRFFSGCLNRPVVINAARGGVVDTPALVDSLRDGLVGAAVIDCWEGEPAIDLGLLSLSSIATPHIAGYSSEGKMRATRAVVRAFERDFGVKCASLAFEVSDAMPSRIDVEAVGHSYNIMADDLSLRSAPGRFEDLRNNYKYRNEYR